MIPVIISGGSGTRLWPVSRQAFPKQFCEILDQSLFEKTYRRLSPLGKPWSLTTKELRILTLKTLTNLADDESRVLYETKGKNTAPAIAFLCKALQLKGLEKEVVGVFPADHFIEEDAPFLEAVKRGIKAAEGGNVVTLGIRPSYPATGYGYIEVASGTGEIRKAIKFCEKPTKDKAEEFIASGRYFWNAGMFLFKVDQMIALLEQHLPDVWAPFSELKSDYSNLNEIYDRVPSISIDYGIMEKLPSHTCVPCNFSWNDIGSWDALSEITKNPSTNIALNTADSFEVESSGNMAFGLKKKVYSFVGVKDLVVVDTDDAILISKKGSTEKVKDLVDLLKKEQSRTATEHRFEIRPWGRFDILRDSDQFKSKIISVDAGSQISYQSHAKREEHWVIVKGEGEVIIDDKITAVKYGTVIKIPLGAKHRIRNTGKESLEFIEVQIGSYFGEDDIVRYLDDYKRV